PSAPPRPRLAPRATTAPEGAPVPSHRSLAPATIGTNEMPILNQVLAISGSSVPPSPAPAPGRLVAIGPWFVLRDWVDFMNPLAPTTTACGGCAGSRATPLPSCAFHV